MVVDLHCSMNRVLQLSPGARDEKGVISTLVNETPQFGAKDAVVTSLGSDEGIEDGSDLTRRRSHIVSSDIDQRSPLFCMQEVAGDLDWVDT
jgi:hypothetical protein